MSSLPYLIAIIIILAFLLGTTVGCYFWCPICGRKKVIDE